MTSWTSARDHPRRRQRRCVGSRAERPSCWRWNGVTRQKVSVTEPIEQGKKEQDRLRDMKCGSTPREWPLGGPRDQGAGESERESYHRTLSPLIAFCPFVTLFRSPCPHLHFSSCPLLIFVHLAIGFCGEGRSLGTSSAFREDGRGKTTNRATFFCSPASVVST